MTPLPGDFACVSIGGTGGTLINLAQQLAGDKNTQYQHAFIYISKGRIVQAEPAGAQETNLGGYGHILWSTGKIPLTPAQRGQIIAAAIHYVGTPYSWLDYLAIALRRMHIPAPWLRTYIASTRSMICSQLVARCYFDAGVPLFPGVWTGYDTPADLATLLEEH